MGRRGDWDGSARGGVRRDELAHVLAHHVGLDMHAVSRAQLAERGVPPGVLDQARSHLQYAIRLRPDHLAARINLGAVLKEQGDIAGAIAQYRAALQLDPDSVEAYYNLGNGLLRTGDAAAAKNAYQHALQLRPTYQPARDMLDTIDKDQRLPGS